MNLDLDEYDDEHHDAASSAACQRRGQKFYFETLTVHDGALYVDEEPPMDPAVKNA